MLIFDSCPITPPFGMGSGAMSCRVRQVGHEDASGREGDCKDVATLSSGPVTRDCTLGMKLFATNQLAQGLELFEVREAFHKKDWYAQATTLQPCRDSPRVQCYLMSC